ncbi:MAG TPA: maleylpyruvate isomerase family mycothiol-dependent enzyme [Jatrophihabitans sp.]|nr:maleylpyruvate isomerase family mycothiol-dependent enzyme [Jatrophihabitans sp.]
MTSPHPAAGFDPLAEIAEHSARLAKAAESNLDAPVEHCPGWTVADLVWHLTGVHWFWSTVVAGLLAEPPAEDSGPDRPAPEELISRFTAGAEHLVRVLAAADPAAPCWTWAPTQQNAGFVLRHQVQEAAVHHWDAEHAGGHDIALGTAMSADAIEEFLTFSLPTVHDPSDVPGPSLDGALVLSASDARIDWTITDDSLPGTLKFSTGPAQPDLPRITGTASDLLLWLYGRVALPVAPGPAGQQAADQLVSRFRDEAYTD